MSTRIRPRLREIPLRVTSGAFIVNSGLSKRNMPPESAAQIHGMAAGTYPFLKEVPPDKFTALLSKSEIAIGALLLAPFVPTALAGTALTAFAGGLVGLYLKTPGMHEPGSLRPTQQGTAIAKDIWLLGMGVSLVADALTDRH